MKPALESLSGKGKPLQSKEKLPQILAFALRSIVSLLVLGAGLHGLPAAAYGYTETEVNTYIENHTLPGCTITKQEITVSGQRGYKISQKCFHAEYVKSTSYVWTGDVCDGTTGGLHQGVTYALACDGTATNYVVTTSAYRKCAQETITTLCSGATSNTFAYIWLTLDLTYMSASPCVYQPIKNGDCYATEDLKTFIPVCADNDTCCVDPYCCGNPDCCPNN